jgi:hypothetical protein
MSKMYLDPHEHALILDTLIMKLHAQIWNFLNLLKSFPEKKFAWKNVKNLSKSVWMKAEILHASLVNTQECILRFGIK